MFDRVVCCKSVDRLMWFFWQVWFVWASVWYVPNWKTEHVEKLSLYSFVITACIAVDLYIKYYC